MLKTVHEYIAEARQGMLGESRSSKNPVISSLISMFTAPTGQKRYYDVLSGPYGDTLEFRDKHDNDLTLLPRGKKDFVIFDSKGKKVMDSTKSSNPKEELYFMLWND